MAEYIEREAVLQKQTTMTEYDEGGWDAKVRVVRAEDIEAIPAADVVPVVHGRWEPVKYTAHCSCGKSYGTVHFLCSACKRVAYAQPYGLNYCPYCGAKMDMEENK